MKNNAYDWLITGIIPVLITLLIAIYQDDRKTLLYVLYVVIVTAIIFVILFYCIGFFNAREKRWADNNVCHKDLIEKINKLEHNCSLLKQFEDTNEKINKLENQIAYLRGKNDRKKSSS